MRIATIAALVCLAGCPGKQPPVTPTAPERPKIDPALRIRIAQAEARRGGGITELLELAKAPETATRVLALRGLGRIGGDQALAAVVAAIGDANLEVSAASAEAIGLATSLDEDAAGSAAITSALEAAYAKRPDDPSVIEALGRAGASQVQGALATGLRNAMPSTAAAICVALGRLGRRKIELTDLTRAALVGATTHGDPQVRYAAAYALAREHLVKPEEATPEKSKYLADSGHALAALLADPDPLVRAQAAQALARRKTVVAHGAALAKAAADDDWRVAVEAIRAIAGDASDDQHRVAAAQAALEWTDAMPRNTQPPHVVLEALRALAPHTKSDDVRKLVVQIARDASQLAGLNRDWIECLARVAELRGMPSASPDLATCKLPDHLRLPLVGELVAAKVGTVDQRRAALRPLIEHADPRVRVAGMTALAAMWEVGSDADHRAVVAMTIAALGAKDGLVAGTAVETATTLYKQIKRPDMREPLDAAVISRAQAEQDPELAASLFALIEERVLAGGATACRAGLQGAPVLAAAAVKCLKALGQAVDKPAIGVATAPPVDVATVIGKLVHWKLETTRGEIVIELEPDDAPWAVATIAMLTRKGFYDGLEMHRVVPNFVAQGGDPTQSGWGGPGFAIPAEPSSGASYVEGGVGMADAGRDSAGSQWFIMHAPAPHLDGRYTWIGHVLEGQKAADSLVIGDRVTRATVDIQNRP